MRSHDDPSGRRAVKEAVGDVLAEAAVDIGFQPVVDLAARRVVGYEALARGPQDTPLHRPELLFAAARGAGRLDELDWLCQREALTAALAAGLRAPSVLFLNIEADTSGFMPLHLRALYARATAQMTVAVEVTERALTQRPAALLGHVADMRALGCTVALDDVGAEIDSLAMMALLAPEVIKLDLALLQAASEARLAEVLHAVGAQAEATGATVLVERIETPRQAELAEALGARLAQGWLFGRRERITAAPAPPPPGVVTAAGRPDPRDVTPFALVREARAPRRAQKALLVELSHRLEEQARAGGQEALLLGAFERRELFTDGTAERWEGLARALAFCGAVGVDLPAEPAPGVRGGRLHRNDPLAREWAVAVVSPHVTCALSAYDLGRDEAGEHWFDFVLTHDRPLAVAAAAALMARVNS